MFFFRIILFIVIIVLLDSKNLFAMELNILCIEKNVGNKQKDIKDIIVNLNSNTKQVTIGGLKFVADEFIITESNIRWNAENIKNLYDDTNGFTSGTLGRFSGNLSLVFTKEHSLKKNIMTLTCSKFKMKDRKF
ncbi:MAG: hypothetical protein CMI85_02665 [Candidatus Pelagibacter sp.]|nr:hypothetical protein [Candidatus Pelagibacter sp.]